RERRDTARVPTSWVGRFVAEGELEIDRRKGRKVGQISVLIGNDPAQKAYEKAGFKVADEKRHPEFQRAVGEPGMRRLLQDL
ncbi:MAG TPA: hypothetical protein VE243_00675, partial [Candidatus Acidoferrum sp.]|nr:hypothetical protein [Candidatus Acidoferrum sp.]